MTGHDADTGARDGIRVRDPYRRQPPQRFRPGERSLVRGLRNCARRPGRAGARFGDADRRLAFPPVHEPRRARTASRRRSGRARPDPGVLRLRTRHAVPTRQRVADPRSPTARLHARRPSPAHAPAARSVPARAGRTANRARRRRPHRVRLRVHDGQRISGAATAADGCRDRHHTGVFRARPAGITSSVTSTTSRSRRARVTSARASCTSTTSQRSNPIAVGATDSHLRPRPRAATRRNRPRSSRATSAGPSTSSSGSPRSCVTRIGSGAVPARRRSSRPARWRSRRGHRRTSRRRHLCVRP